MKYFLLLLVAFAVSSYDVPKGWFKAGSKPNDYDMGTDVGAGRNKQNAATIKSTSKKINGFGTLMQNFAPDKYLGKRIKLTAYMKSVDVDDWAGMWLRVDGSEGTKSLSFDNMQDRPIKGTKDWTKCEIVLDVPEGATNIAYGSLLAGTGQIWFDGLKFEVASPAVQTTDMKSKEPQNLNFEK